MSTRTLLWYVNAKGVPLAVAACLFGLAGFCHRAGMAHYALVGWPSALVDGRTQAQARLIMCMETHPFWAISVFALCAACLVWHEVRRLPRWSLWFALLVFAAPAMGYAWFALRVATTPIFAPLMQAAA